MTTQHLETIASWGVLARLAEEEKGGKWSEDDEAAFAVVQRMLLAPKIDARTLYRAMCQA